MFTFRLNYKKLSLWLLLITQALLITTFFYFELDNNNKHLNNNRISFVQNPDETQHHQITYHKISSNLNLKTINTRDSYIDFNSSVCYVNGTDLKLMKSKQLNWQCECLPGWHSNDCGQPEILWRALLAQRKPVKLKGPRTFQRRLIYIFQVDKFSDNVATIRFNELANIVDLFIIFEAENCDFLQNKLNNSFLKEYHGKILYLKGKLESLWLKVRSRLKNLRSEDILITSNSSEIPNRNSLVFLKYYDNWPQPIKFRMRWSVFGFFWLHPSRTIITGSACTVSFLKDNFDNRLDLLINNKTLSGHKGLILGDLNHYGGWYCEHCRDGALTVEYFASKPKDLINWDELLSKKIDGSYIEDLIENGLYIDGKTELVRAHRYHDNYFAPDSVLLKNWNYDFLLVNLYSKMDYYEA